MRSHCAFRVVNFSNIRLLFCLKKNICNDIWIRAVLCSYDYYPYRPYTVYYDQLYTRPELVCLLIYLLLFIYIYYPIYIPRPTKLEGGGGILDSLCPSVRPSVRLQTAGSQKPLYGITIVIHHIKGLGPGIVQRIFFFALA